MLTDTMDSDNAGSPEPITVPVTRPEVRYKRLRIREQGGNATAGFKIHAPFSDSSYNQYQAGEIATLDAINGWFMPGQTIAYIETLSGTITFSRMWEGDL